MANEHNLTDPREIKAFILAGNARFTLVSTKTQKRFTYKVRHSDDGKVHFVSVLTGPDNESNYVFFASIRGNYLNHGKRTSIGEDAPSASGFAWFWKNLMRDMVSNQLEFWHEGKCGRCARPLTDPVSIASGFGPECIKRL